MKLSIFALGATVSTLFLAAPARIPPGAQPLNRPVRPSVRPPTQRSTTLTPLPRAPRLPRFPRAGYAALAAHWAPVICQDIDSENPRAEYITRFDYDGNWRGNDNWNNLNAFNLSGHVYYWVTQTSTHYFIGYGFFHPRDWSSTGIAQHENDLEGVLVTIKKQGRFGQFVSLITVAHRDFWSYTDDDDATSPSPRVTGSSGSAGQSIDGDVDFVRDDFGLHPVIYVQSEGHGTYGIKSGDSSIGHGVSEAPPIFDRNTLTDWRGANWNGIVKPPRSGRVGSTYDTDEWDDGIIYHFENVADVPGIAGQTRNSQLPHQWQVAGYNLLPIQPLWDRRNDFLSGKTTFEKYGVFDGDDGAVDAANAPWGWDDNDDGPIFAPAFFSDPARLVDHYFDGLGTFSRATTGTSYGAGARTVTVTIHRARQIDDMDAGNRADFQARVSIAGEQQRSPTVQGRDDARPNWRFNQLVTENSVRITIRLDDEDSGLAGDDDHCDINARRGVRDLTLQYNLDSGQISGDASGSRGLQISSRGAGEGDRAEVWLSIDHR